MGKEPILPCVRTLKGKAKGDASQSGQKIPLCIATQRALQLKTCLYLVCYLPPERIRNVRSRLEAEHPHAVCSSHVFYELKQLGVVHRFCERGTPRLVRCVPSVVEYESPLLNKCVYGYSFCASC